MRNDANEANGSLVVCADVFPHLVMPVGPFVSALWAPVVQMMSNATAVQHLGHSIGGSAVLPGTAAGYQSDVATRVLLEVPRITLVSHVVHRVVEIKIVIVHPVHGVSHVINARECVAALHVVGMFEQSVSRVIRTERCAQRGDPDARRLALRIDEWENFVRYVAVVLRLQPTSMERMRSFVLE